MPKTKFELEAELADLKERLRSLAGVQADPPGGASSVATDDEAASDGPSGSRGALSADLEELIDLLRREIDDLPAMTCLALFGLGVLTGRLLAQ